MLIVISACGRACSKAPGIGKNSTIAFLRHAQDDVAHKMVKSIRDTWKAWLTMSVETGKAEEINSVARLPDVRKRHSRWGPHGTATTSGQVGPVPACSGHSGPLGICKSDCLACASLLFFFF